MVKIKSKYSHEAKRGRRVVLVHHSKLLRRVPFFTLTFAMQEHELPTFREMREKSQNIFGKRPCLMQMKICQAILQREKDVICSAATGFSDALQECAKNPSITARVLHCWFVLLARTLQMITFLWKRIKDS